MKSMTYGTLPTREEFGAAFERECPKGTYDVQLGPTDSAACEAFNFGNGAYTGDELLEVLTRVTTYYFFGDDAIYGAMDVVSSVLRIFGFEWV